MGEKASERGRWELPELLPKTALENGLQEGDEGFRRAFWIHGATPHVPSPDRDRGSHREPSVPRDYLSQRNSYAISRALWEFGDRQAPRGIWERVKRSDHVGTFIQTARLALYWQGVNRPRDEPERGANPTEPGDEIDRPFFVYVWGPGMVRYAAWIADVPR